MFCCIFFASHPPRTYHGAPAPNHEPLPESLCGGLGWKRQSKRSKPPTHSCSGQRRLFAGTAFHETPCSSPSGLSGACPCSARGKNHPHVGPSFFTAGAGCSGPSWCLHKVRTGALWPVGVRLNFPSLICHRYCHTAMDRAPHIAAEDRYVGEAVSEDNEDSDEIGGFAFYCGSTREEVSVSHKVRRFGHVLCNQPPQILGA
jgi:hypothetical protein